MILPQNGQCICSFLQSATERFANHKWMATLQKQKKWHPQASSLDVKVQI